MKPTPGAPPALNLARLIVATPINPQLKTLVKIGKHDSYTYRRSEMSLPVHAALHEALEKLEAQDAELAAGIRAMTEASVEIKRLQTGVKEHETALACLRSLQKAGSDMCDDLRREWKKSEDEIKRLQESEEAAWGLIANAYGGNWDQATDEWKKAAERWRDEYHKHLPQSVTREEDLEPAGKHDGN